MSLIFPDGAEAVPVPAGTEKIFAARASDGKIVYFTGAQLIAALGGGTMTGEQIRAALSITTLTGNNTGDQDISGKADLIGGKLDPDQAIDAKLSEAQFEQLTVAEVLQDITIKESWLTNFIIEVGSAQGWGGGTPTDPTASAPTGALTGRNYAFTQTTWPNDLELRTNGGTPAAYVSGTAIPVGNGAVAANYYESRVKAVAGSHQASDWVGNTAISAASGGYVVENTYRINFGSEFGVNAAAPFNNMRPAASLLQTINGYTSPVLVDDLGVSSVITLTNSGAFGGSSGQVSTAQNTAGNTGAFPNVVVNTAWSLNTTTNAAITLNNLDSGKFYEVGFLMPKDASDSVRGVTIGGTVKNRDATGTNLESFGLAANGLDDPQFIVFQNLTGVTSIAALIKRVSGDYGAFLAMMYIRVSSVAKP